MIDFKLIGSTTKSFLKANSPAIMTGVGVGGTITTALLTARSTWRAAKRLSEGPPTETMTRREIVIEIWDLYIPPALTATVTIGCIIGANHVSSKRSALAYSMLAVSEKAVEEYRNKVIEQIGERKEQAIRDEIVQDRISENPPSKVIVASGGDVLCCELFTMRYFTSSMEALRKAQNDINVKLIREDYVIIGEFYYILGLPQTSNSGRVGWESGKLLELDFTTAMSEDNRPCLAFDYNYTKVL